MRQLHTYYGVPIDAEVFEDSSSDEECNESLSYQIIYPSHERVDSFSPVTRSQSKKYPSNHVARSKVYDLREYTDGSLWGPFKDDGSQHVDWEKVEAIMIVLGYNLRKFSERTQHVFPDLWMDPWCGAGPNTFVSPPNIREHDDDQEDSVVVELAKRDPYGITGMWTRVVCFLGQSMLSRHL
jgi:hypothetical protein